MHGIARCWCPSPIIHILTEVKPYIPEQLLEALQAHHPEAEEGNGKDTSGVALAGVEVAAGLGSRLPRPCRLHQRHDVGNVGKRGAPGVCAA